MFSILECMRFVLEGRDSRSMEEDPGTGFTPQENIALTIGFSSLFVEAYSDHRGHKWDLLKNGDLHERV